MSVYVIILVYMCNVSKCELHPSYLEHDIVQMILQRIDLKLYVYLYHRSMFWIGWMIRIKSYDGAD